MKIIPAREKASTDPDYQWDDMWNYHYDYEQEYELDPQESLEEEQKSYVSTLKLLAVVLLLIGILILHVCCPCIKTFVKFSFKKTFGIFASLFICCRIYPCSFIWTLIKLVTIGPFVFTWAWIVCRFNGWGNDVSYYCIRKYCLEKKTIPPEYEEYKEYKKSLPRGGRIFARNVFFKLI